MAPLTSGQIAQYARQAGFNGNNLTIATAVAWAESKGVTTAYNPETAAGTPIGSGSRGLWQIYGKAHPQYNNDALYDPLTNAKAAYAISGGSNFRPWSTYTSGEYKQYMSGTTTTSTNAPATVLGQKAWYTFPRIDNLGGVEPFGGFPKPDSNIQIPAGYPVTALLPGKVTGIDLSSAWGASVTILLDTAINSLATHTAYLHLRGDVQVRKGQHIAAGQLIAYNGSSQAAGSQKVPLGFALYNGDMYGSGAAWALMTKANLNGGLLDPTPLLNAAKSGSMNIPDLGGGGSVLSGIASGTVTFTPILDQVHQTLINVPGFYGMALALDEVEEFPGYINLASSQFDVTGIVRSVGATIGDNFPPVMIRGSLITIGVFIMLVLILKVVLDVGDTAMPFIKAVA